MSRVQACSRKDMKPGQTSSRAMATENELAVFGYMTYQNATLLENSIIQRVVRRIVQLDEQVGSLRVSARKAITAAMPIGFKTMQRMPQRQTEQS